MTAGQPQKDDFYIPPATAGTPPPARDPNDKWWIILAVVFFAAIFILPAVIAAFVFGMAGNIAKTKVVAATVQQPDAGTIIVTYQGGQDAGSLVEMTASVTTPGGEMQKQALGSKSGTGPVEIGKTLTFEGDFAGRDMVIATGYFSDGTEQVIVDTRV